MGTYIVVWATKDEGWVEGSGVLTDHWLMCTSQKEAIEEYQQIVEIDRLEESCPRYFLKEGNLYSASLTVGLLSTDYDCSYAEEIDSCRTDPRYWQCECEDTNIRDKHVVLHCDGCGMDSDDCPDALAADIVDLLWKISRQIEDQDRLDRHLGSPLETFLKVRWDGGIGGGR